ncbi:hypothetical protein B0H13DRAFT_1875284 [Mycena leptocephala]|nr:hypothetical protein B0H13DRAFT_1875284 [Mycena leptocephala]
MTMLPESAQTAATSANSNSWVYHLPLDTTFGVADFPRQRGEEERRANGCFPPSVHHHRSTPRLGPISRKERATDLSHSCTTHIDHRNEEELREKARVRMARHRERVHAEEGLAEEARCQARVASKKYREKHAATLAHRQRIVRMQAYERKHGHRAWLERYQKLEAQRAEARELEELRRYQEEFRRHDEEYERRQMEGGPSGL